MPTGEKIIAKNSDKLIIKLEEKNTRESLRSKFVKFLQQQYLYTVLPVSFACGLVAYQTKQTEQGTEPPNHTGEPPNKLMTKNKLYL